MFHTYVINSRGTRIDIDRVSFLMDKSVMAEVIAELDEKWSSMVETHPLPDTAGAKAGAFWDMYCERHLDKYGEPFSPDERTTPL